MLLLNPLKLCVLRNEPIKGRTWDRLPLTTESNFTLLNSMRAFNECWLPPLCHSSLSTYVCYVCLCLPLFPPVHRFPRSRCLCVAHFIALFFCQSDCQFLPIPLSVLPPFSVFYLHSVSLSSPTLHSPGTCLSFSTAVTTVFSSIYSGATRLLKAERLPWALLFAWDFLPLTIFRCN